MHGCSCGGGPPVALAPLPLGDDAVATGSGGLWVVVVLGAGVLGLTAYAATRGGKKRRRGRGARRRVEVYEDAGRRRYAEI